MPELAPAEVPQPKAPARSAYFTMIEPPVVDLNRSRVTIPIEFPQPVSDQNALRVEALGIDNCSAMVQAYYPPERTAELGGNVRLALRDEPPHAGIQISLLGGSDQPKVRIEPIMIYFDGDEQSWQLSRLRRQHTTLTKTIRKQQQNLPQAQAATNHWGAEIKRLEALYGNNMSQPDVVRAKTLAANSFKQSQATLTSLQQQLPANVKALESLKQLGELSSEVHKKAVVAFRVYHIVDGEEVDVLRTAAIGDPPTNSD